MSVGDADLGACCGVIPVLAFLVRTGIPASSGYSTVERVPTLFFIVTIAVAR